MDRKGMKILIIAVCLLLTAVGLVFQFREFFANRNKTEESQVLNLQIENEEVLENLPIEDTKVEGFLTQFESWLKSQGIEEDSVLIASKQVAGNSITLYLAGKDENYIARYNMLKDECEFKITERTE